ncbi:hypothetical protein [Runella sp.]
MSKKLFPAFQQLNLAIQQLPIFCRRSLGSFSFRTTQWCVAETL